MADGALLRTLEGHKPYAKSVAVSPDGSTIMSGARDKTGRLCRLAGGPVASEESSGTSPCEVRVAATPSGAAATENELDARASSPTAESIAKWLCAELGVFEEDAVRLSAHLAAEGVDCQDERDLLDSELFPKEDLEALEAHGLRSIPLKKILRLQARARDEQTDQTDSR